MAEIEQRRAEPEEEEVAEEEATAEEFVDIASDIMDAADGLLSGDAGEFDLAADFSNPDEGKADEVSLEDAESHYNLGIAYKEMGLVDDAIAEFDKAMRHPTRLIDSLALKALCLAETGAFEEAEQFFWAVLEQPNLSEEERRGVQFELGLFYENLGRVDEAINVIEEVAATDPNYRNAGDKVAALKSGQSDSPAGSAGKNAKDRVSYI